jgi:hypothetical protein
VYESRFDASSPLWSELERQLTQWRAVRKEQRGAVGPALAWQRLAQRGAPTKIAALAVCLLACRPEAFPVLDECLDHGMAAKVLYDDVMDWREDLAAGRWNAFVDTLSTEPQTARRRRSNRDAVLEAMLTSDAIPIYFARINEESLQAATLSEQLRVEPLSAHFRDFAQKAVEQGTVLDYHWRSQVEQAAALLFGSRLG